MTCCWLDLQERLKCESLLLRASGTMAGGFTYNSEAMKMFSARLPSRSVLPHAIMRTSRNTLSLFSSPCSQYTDLLPSSLGFFNPSAVPCQLSLCSVSSCHAVLPTESPWHQASLKSVGIDGTDMIIDPVLIISTENNFSPCA